MSGHDDERSAQQRFTRRAMMLGVVQATAFSALGWRFFQLQVMEKNRYRLLAESNRVSLQVLRPKRGLIVDRAGRVLADNEDVFRATLTPAVAPDVNRVLSDVARLLPMTPDDVEKIVRRTKRQSRNLATVVFSELSFEQVARLNVFAPQLPGIATEVIWRRRYRQGAAVGHVVGIVGNIDRVGIDDDAVMRLPDMRIGKTGIEAGMEERLRGVGGTQKVEVDARGRAVRDLETVPAKQGETITLAIDAELQKRVVERLQSSRRASCVVVDVTTGEVVVMASTPGYDPADIAEGITPASWQRLMTSEDKPLLNRAIGGQYAPGSTFKMVTALAALQAGVITAEERIRCDGNFAVADQTFRCWHRAGHGALSLHEAMRSSCDVYFFELARRVGIERLSDAARKLGLGETYECGLAEQTAGLVPDPDWKRGRFDTEWLGSETVSAGIGQGYLLTTPLQLAVMTARLATGRSITPTLLKSPAGGQRAQFADLPFAAGHMATVRHAMQAVVNEQGGTGSGAALAAGLPLVAGKTGSEQVGRVPGGPLQDDVAWGRRDHAVFVGYVPAGAPRYALAAVIEHAGGDGSAAATLAREILTDVLKTEMV